MNCQPAPGRHEESRFCTLNSGLAKRKKGKHVVASVSPNRLIWISNFVSTLPS